MANDKTKAANWAIARARWEGEPRCTYADLSDFLGISKQAIAKRAGKDGWVKKLTMATIVDKAHAAADRKISRDAAVRSKDKTPVVAGAKPGDFDSLGVPSDAVVPASIQDSKNATPEMLAVAVETAAVDARAQVLTKHRTEWNAARSLIYKSIKSNNQDDAKTAKIVAEGLKITQDGERKAWGLDAGETPPGQVRIVVERTEGVRVVR